MSGKTSLDNSGSVEGADGTLWCRKTEAQSLEDQGSQLESGITIQEVARRRARFGKNEIAEGKKHGPLRIFLRQFSDLMIGLLLVAAVVSGWIGEIEDTVAILAIVLINAILGFFQEYRAEKAMAALKALTEPLAKVRRRGQIDWVSAVDLVPGDIVFLEAGNRVPADLRLLESKDLRVDESLLTGESHVIDKFSSRIVHEDSETLSVADQFNMAFQGTWVTAGRAVGLVVRTGMATEVGRIARGLKIEVEIQTPLQRKLSRFARALSGGVIGLCVVVFVVGWLRGEEPFRMLLTALSLAVAGVPEALPAVVTVALAVGARAMSRKRALVRRLSAVEALGSVTTLCSDKTGTLTENHMKLQAAWVPTDSGILARDAKLGPEFLMGVEPLFLRILALNNDVAASADGTPMGDPTEVALYEAALSHGYDKWELEKKMPRIAEIPFSSERGRMTTVHRDPEGVDWVFTKGAPEKVLPLCIRGRPGQEKAAADEVWIENATARGLRVLALAFSKKDQPIESQSLESLESGLKLLGYVGLWDPPRAGARAAIEACVTAGIRVVMITGDHPRTARAIGESLGLLSGSQGELSAVLMTGSELDTLSDEALRKKMSDVKICARVAPEQKIRIVKALQAAGEVVAMTGDGVNDAPALRSADVGIAMGKGGTDVAREAAHVVLLDDQFVTIVSAVREGRRIYDNIRKFIRFVLSGNSGEIWTLFLAPFMGLPTPLLPIHILWVNLVTDGLPGLALAFEPEEKFLMRRPPRPLTESVFARGLWQHSVWVGLLTAACTLGTLAWAYRSGSAHWQTMAFSVLTWIQMGHVLAICSETESFFGLHLASRLPLLGVVIFTGMLQLVAIYHPAFNRFLSTAPLSGKELFLCLAVSCTVFLAVEFEKWVGRHRRAKSDRWAV